MNWILKYSVFGVWTLLFFFPLEQNGGQLYAQKLLRLETPHNVRKIELREGETLYFKVRDDEIWREEVIMSMDYDKQLLQFDSWSVRLAEITHIRRKKSQFLRGLGQKMMIGGINFLLFDLIQTAVRGDNGNFIRITGGIMTVVGWLFQKIAPNKTYKLGKKNKLRLLDLNFSPRIDRV